MEIVISLTFCCLRANEALKENLRRADVENQLKGRNVEQLLKDLAEYHF